MSDINIIVEETPSFIVEESTSSVISSPNGATSLDQLSDVELQNPLNGQALIFQNGKWVALTFAATDAHQEFNQPFASDTWEITHNLGKFPSVSIVDSAGDEVEGNIKYINNNQLVITFSAAFSGKAYLN